MLGRLIGMSLLAGIIFPAGALAGGSIGIRLVDAPPDSAGNPLARLYVIDRVAPGSSISRRVEISNSTSSTAEVTVYATAAGLRRGSFAFAPGQSRNELSTWTSVSRRVLRVPTDGKAIDTLRIKVPKDASFGERYAVIWAEVSTPSSTAGGVRLVNRVGVRMYVSIGPGGSARSNFAIGTVVGRRSRSGQPLVIAQVHNSGGRTLDISGTLTLSRGPGGLRAGPFPIELRTALEPGRSDRVNAQLDRRLPRGPWRARMRLKSGRLQRVAVGTITFPRLARAARPPSAKSIPPGSHHLVLAVLGALLSIGVLALLRLRRVSRGHRHLDARAA
jgi:hypothetical protein